jgi:carbamoyl-phosphate synthase small subunit
MLHHITGRNRKPAYLLLEDGALFEGLAIGAEGTTTGEVAFNTGMTGYQEIFTDPSYTGQVVVMATAHIGNYGISIIDVESGGIKISGLVVKKFSSTYSRPAADGSLQDYLVKHGITGISDIDTRALVRHIRKTGAMNCVISSEISDIEELKRIVHNVPSMAGLELSSRVSTKETYDCGPEEGLRVALIDYGVKTNIIRSLTDRGCRVRVFPHNTNAETILNFDPEGIMLSNGPGDPAAMPNHIEVIKTLVEKGIPTFGICLGHQLLALSQGLVTRKMHHGHRGINHPVQNLETGKCEVTSQNHGFVVDSPASETTGNIKVTHIHLNDQTVAGIRLLNKPAFSVQYHPEACPGPHDAAYLFDDFVMMMKQQLVKQ